MMDILKKIDEILESDPLVQEYVEDRIKFYEYPETGDKIDPFIVLEEVVPENPTEYADNEWLANDYYVHIEVWVKGSNGREKRDTIARHIKKLMWKELGFAQVGGMQPQWDKETNIFRDARRYRGKLYRRDFNTL